MTEEMIIDGNPRLLRIRDFLDREVDEGRLSGAVFRLTRKGVPLYAAAHGVRDSYTNDAMPIDALFQVKSMTKFVTTIAALTIIEEGALQLLDPIQNFLPAFADVKVLGPDDDPKNMISLRRPIQIRDLLLHTSGMSYGQCSPATTDAYKEAGLYFDIGFVTSLSLEEIVGRLATRPLAFQPGTRWAYSWGADVLGHILEIVAGRPLDMIFNERLFEPLGLTDIGFTIAQDQIDRMVSPISGLRDNSGSGLVPSGAQRFLSGGEGLISSALDWCHLVEMILNRGKCKNGQILAPRTVDFMLSDHVGNLAEAKDFPLQPAFTYGMGIFLRQKNGLSSSPGNIGEFGWWGSWGTAFWGDPVDDVAGVLMIQKRDELRYYIETLRMLSYQALED